MSATAAEGLPVRRSRGRRPSERVRFAAAPGDGQVVDYDVCIVGSGPAATAVLHGLLLDGRAGRPPRIAVLESSAVMGGGTPRSIVLGADTRELHSDAQHLYEGEVRGWIREHQSGYLTTSRLRAFGGTSSVWSGWCWPLEADDLRPRPARPTAAWPLSYDDLLPDYLRAQRFCGLGPFAYDDLDYWTREGRSRRLATLDCGSRRLRTRVLLFQPIGFAVRLVRLAAASGCVDLYRNANLVGFEGAAGTGEAPTVESAVFRAVERGRAGRSFRVRAGRFVLATGAIETTRILLLAGIGGRTEHLGRHFIDHPYLWVSARFELGAIPPGVRSFYFPERPVRGPGAGAIAALVPTSELVSAERIGSFRVLLGGSRGIPGTINASWEQVPNESSRVTLSSRLEPDLFGQPRVCLDSAVTEIDARTIRCLLREVSGMLLGRNHARGMQLPDLERDPWSWTRPDRIVPGNHPMGTTRMSRRAEDGVVDADCRVHDAENLYVASTSVFPTGGYANPTFTLVALGIRLGRLLRRLHQ